MAFFWPNVWNINTFFRFRYGEWENVSLFHLFSIQCSSFDLIKTAGSKSTVNREDTLLPHKTYYVSISNGMATSDIFVRYFIIFFFLLFASRTRTILNQLKPTIYWNFALATNHPEIRWACMSICTFSVGYGAARKSVSSFSMIDELNDHYPHYTELNICIKLWKRTQMCTYCKSWPLMVFKVICNLVLVRVRFWIVCVCRFFVRTILRDSWT